MNGLSIALATTRNFLMDRIEPSYLEILKESKSYLTKLSSLLRT